MRSRNIINNDERVVKLVKDSSPINILEGKCLGLERDCGSFNFKSPVKCPYKERGYVKQVETNDNRALPAGVDENVTLNA